jgi:TP901 family phage tail tape measure protein
LNSQEVAAALGSVTQLATASGTSLKETVDLVTSVMDAFDKKGSDAADITNKIAQAANTSKASVGDLAEEFKAAAPAAAAAGLTFEETTAALATMANAGGQAGARQATGLKQLLAELEKPSKDFKQIIIDLGLASQCGVLRCRRGQVLR